MTFRPQLLTSFLLVASLVSTCRGQMLLTSISREVAATAVGPCLNDELSASSTNPGLFSELLFVSSFVEGCGAFSDVAVAQNTLVSSSEISGEGESNATALPGATAEGVSRLEADFVVEAALPYSLSGSVGGAVVGPSGTTTSPTSVVLESDGHVLHMVMQEEAPFPTPFDFSGQLPPGNYRLLVDAPASAFDGASFSSFDFRFVVPEPILSQPLWMLIGWQVVRHKHAKMSR